MPQFNRLNMLNFMPQQQMGGLMNINMNMNMNIGMNNTSTT